MSFSVGIAGLPNAGKSTLFHAITKNQVEIADYPFTTVDPNVGVVNAPDPRLKKISAIIKPEKTTETIIEFVDIAGLVENAHKGEGLGNQFLAQIRECDAIIEVVRVFPSPSGEKADPERDIKTMDTELIMKDIETIDRAIDKVEKESPEKLNSLKKIKGSLLERKDAELTEEEKEEIKEYQLLTLKPKLYLFNVKEEGFTPPEKNSFVIDAKTEEDLTDLTEQETKELGIASKLDQLISVCYTILDLITFYTIAGFKESRALTLKKGASVFEAAGQLHSDFQESFIRAEILKYDDLVKTGSWTKAKEAGLVKTVGKDNIVEDGDIIEFKI